MVEKMLSLFPSRFNNIKKEHFISLAGNEGGRKSLLKHSISLVEIEIFSFCNRTCWFCPNSTIDRRSTNHFLPEQLYLSILDQLAELEYCGKISFSRYNEPLSDKIVLRRIEQARQRLPKAHLHTNTNGDYLDRDYLAELSAAGLNSLNIQIYLGNNERYDHDRMRDKMQAMHDRLGLVNKIVRDERPLWLESVAQHENMALRLYARNFQINGCNRGETVAIKPDYKRKSPCFSVFEHIYIDYNGKVMPCCNLRSDIPGHQSAILGDLTRDPDLFTLYSGEKSARWRSHLVDFSIKAGVCRSCSFNVVRPSLINKLQSNRAKRRRVRKGLLFLQ